MCTSFHILFVYNHVFEIVYRVWKLVINDKKEKKTRLKIIFS